MEDIDPFRTESAFEQENAERAANTELPASPEPQSQPPVADTSSGGEVHQAGAASLTHDQARRMNVQHQPFRLRDGDRDPKVFIIDAQKTTEGATSPYIAYVIRSEVSPEARPDLHLCLLQQAETEGSFLQHGDARRRYREFEQLRDVLSKLHPVLIIPPIPPHHTVADYAIKQSKAKEDAAVIARRRRMLSVFLNRCHRHPILGQDRTFHRFLDPGTTWPEILHSPPVTQLPKNILRAPARDPSDMSVAHIYNALPVPGSAHTLQDPDQRFADSEAFTQKFSSHFSGSLEKINRRLVRRWSDLGTDEADLGGILNGFGLLESNTNPELAAAIEKTGQAIDSTYLNTASMLQDWEQSFTEPLSEYSQFSSIIKHLLKYRHNKHLQFEMANEALEHRRSALDELERSEAEARRLDHILDQAINRVKPLDSDSDAETSPPETSQSVPTLGSQAQPQQQQQQAQNNPQQTASVREQARTLSKSSSSSGFFGALTHTFSNVIDNDPESTRRNNIGKTREQIQNLEAGVQATRSDLRYASQVIQADLDRFQRQKVTDLKEMSLDLVRLHKEWCEKNLQLWTDVKTELDNV